MAAFVRKNARNIIFMLIAGVIALLIMYLLGESREDLIVGAIAYSFICVVTFFQDWRKNHKKIRDIDFQYLRTLIGPLLSIAIKIVTREINLCNNQGRSAIMKRSQKIISYISAFAIIAFNIHVISFVNEVLG
ncbi:MAG: hypothetical protein ACRC6X_03490 [Culicoidibacterales bacterium]